MAVGIHLNQKLGEEKGTLPRCHVAANCGKTTRGGRFALNAT